MHGDLFEVHDDVEDVFSLVTSGGLYVTTRLINDVLAEPLQ